MHVTTVALACVAQTLLVVLGCTDCIRSTMNVCIAMAAIAYVLGNAHACIAASVHAFILATFNLYIASSILASIIAKAHACIIVPLLTFA